MSDEMDRAQERELLDRDLAIRAHKTRFAPLFDGDATLTTATECLECGAPIPEERRRAVPGAFYCVECQRAQERQERLFT